MRAELILYNGTIRTLDPRRPLAEAVAVANGRVLAVGTVEEIEATAHANTRRIDLAGRTLLPGFNDACVHFWRAGLPAALTAAAPTVAATATGEERQPAPTSAEFEAALLAAGKAFWRLGITSVTEAGINPEQVAVYRRLASERRLPLRVNVMAHRYLNDGTKLPLPERFEGNWLRIDTVRLLADGDLTSGSAVPGAPHGHDPTARGKLHFSDDRMRTMVWDIHRAGLRAAIFALGEAAIEQGIGAIEYALERLPSMLKHRIDQFGLPTADHLRRSRYKIVAVPQPGLILGLDQPLDRSLPDSLVPLRAMLDAGLTLALGSGASAPAGANPLLGLKAAAERRTAQGAPIGPEQAISVAEALLLYTAGGASTAGEDHLKGTITPGKVADLVAISGDPLRAPLDRLADLRVEMTLIDGQVVFAI